MKSPLDIIENIQQKKRHTRQVILAVSTAVIMVAILFVWAITLSLKPAPVDKEKPSPFTLLWNFIKGEVQN